MAAQLVTRINRYIGTAAEIAAMTLTDIPTGSTFFESDTGILKILNAAGALVEAPSESVQLSGSNTEETNGANIATKSNLVAGESPTGKQRPLNVDEDGKLQVGGITTVGIDQTTPGTTNKVVAELSGSNATDPFSGSTNTTHTFSPAVTGFVIVNDGAADLTFTIGTDTFTVKPSECFSEKFASFTEVTVTTAVAFRAYGLR